MQHPLNCLTFAMQRASRGLVRRFEAELRVLGLSAPQFTTLSLLAAEASGVGALARKLGTDRTTMTRNLQVFARHGWASQGVDGYSLSAEGDALLARAMPIWQRHQTQMLRLLGEDFARTLIYNSRRV